MANIAPLRMDVTAGYISELIKFAFREGYRTCANHHHITPGQLISEKELRDAFAKFQQENKY